ncbi:MAG: hypothetical protein KUA30_10905, partial [Candidatus Desulforudis sp.]|nr:hypothetical protein [Desulforudis sp.]
MKKIEEHFLMRYPVAQQVQLQSAVINPFQKSLMLLAEMCLQFIQNRLLVGQDALKVAQHLLIPEHDLDLAEQSGDLRYKPNAGR